MPTVPLSLPAHSKFLREGEGDVEFAKRLTVEGGVTTIPISGFYVGDNPPRHLVGGVVTLA